MSFTFTQPEILWLLLLPGLLLLRWRMRAFPVSDLKTLGGNLSDRLLHPVHFWRWCVLIAAELLILSAAGPLVLRTLEELESRPPDLLLALDLSGSMEAVDWPENQKIPDDFAAVSLPPNRLEQAKQTILRLLEKNPAFRTGLVAFAQQPCLVCPLVRDTRLLKSRLEELRSEDFTDGTALGKAIRSGIQALQGDGTKRQRIMIVLSDGADHSPVSPLEAADEAAISGIVIYTVGIGGRRGWHSVNTGHGRRWEAVAEQLDEETLREIARRSGGAYYHAADAGQLLGALHRLSQQIAGHTVLRTKQVRSPLSRGLLLLAVVFLCAGAFFRRQAPLLQFSCLSQ